MGAVFHGSGLRFGVRALKAWGFGLGRPGWGDLGFVQGADIRFCKSGRQDAIDLTSFGDARLFISSSCYFEAQATYGKVQTSR